MVAKTKHELLDELRLFREGLVKVREELERLIDGCEDQIRRASELIDAALDLDDNEEIT